MERQLEELAQLIRQNLESTSQRVATNQAVALQPVLAGLDLSPDTPNRPVPAGAAAGGL